MRPVAVVILWLDVETCVDVVGSCSRLLSQEDGRGEALQNLPVAVGVQAKGLRDVGHNRDQRFAGLIVGAEDREQGFEPHLAVGRGRGAEVGCDVAGGDVGL